MSAKVHWKCECGKSLTADRGAVGFPFTCPRCKQRGRVPKRGADEMESVLAEIKRELPRPEQRPKAEEPPRPEPSTVMDGFEESAEPPAVASDPFPTPPMDADPPSAGRANPAASPGALGSSATLAVERRYAELRKTVASLYGVARAVIVVGVSLAIGSVAVGLLQRDGAVIAVSLLGAFLVVVAAFAIASSIRAKAESIMVMIDTEENTRLACLLLVRLLNKQRD